MKTTELLKQAWRCASLRGLMFLCVALWSSSLWADDTNKPPVSTVDGYYEISTPQQLKWFVDYVVTTTNEVVNARLMTDISLSSLCSATTQSWTPLGDSNGYFYGTFDGQGHSITDLYINQTSSDNQAFIKSLVGTVKNLKVSGTVVGAQLCALVVGFVGTDATLDGCESSGSVEGTNTVGGIAGQCNANGLTNCINRAKVTASGKGAGGIVGVSFGNLRGCFNYEAITAASIVGGITGAINMNGSIYSSITYCGNLGAISTGDGFAGGLAGVVGTGASVSQSYDIGVVTGVEMASIGVIAGSCQGSVDFNSCCSLNGSILFQKGSETALLPVYAGGATDAPTLWSPERFKSGFVARWMNILDNNPVDGVWRQTLPDETAPTVTGKKVYVLSAFNEDLYGNDGQTVTLPTRNDPDGLKIYKDAWRHVATSTVYASTFTIEGADAQFEPVITSEVVVDMSTAENQVTEDGKTYFKLDTEYKYRWFVNYVNSDNANLGVNAQLTADIDCNLSLIEAIAPYADHPFTGIFDGKDHTLDNFYLASAGDYRGLFGANNGTIKNLTLTGTIENLDNNYTGAIAGINESSGVIERCFTKVGINSTGSYLGGIAGKNEGIIRQCNVSEGYYVSSDDTPTNVGGLVGENAGSISDCSCYEGIMGQAGTTGVLVGTQTVATASLNNCIGTNVNKCNGLFGLFTGGTATNNYYYNTNSEVTPVAQTGVTQINETALASGRMSRLLNGGDGTTEKASGVWGQEVNGPTTSNPTVQKVYNEYEVFCLTAGTKKYYGNKGGEVTLDNTFSTFDETKILFSKWVDEAGNDFTGAATFVDADITLTAKPSSTLDMSDEENTETDSEGRLFFLIDDATKMRWFAYYVNLSTDATHRGANARLTFPGLIDLNAYNTPDDPFPVIANDKDHPYTGIFDGMSTPDQLVGLLNLTVNPGSGFSALFGANAGTILNVTLSCTSVYGSGCETVGSLVGINLPGGVIQNCSDESGTTSYASNVLGFVAGRNQGRISSCSSQRGYFNFGDETNPAPTAGGIAGVNELGGTIDNCKFMGTFDGLTSPGIIVGTQSGAASSVKSCLATSFDDAFSSLNMIASLDGGSIDNSYKAFGLEATSETYSVSGATQTQTQLTNDEIHSGKLARLLNGGDGTTEKADGPWGQDLLYASIAPNLYQDQIKYKVCLLTKYLNDGTTSGPSYDNPGTEACNDGNNTLGQIDIMVGDINELGINIADASGDMRELYLNDAYGFNLPAGKTFTVETATYDARTFFGDGFHETFCIPFNCGIPEYYTFWETDGDVHDNTVSLKAVTEQTLTGGKAYFVKCNDVTNAATQFIGNNVTLQQPASGILQGSYLATTPANEANTYILGVYSDKEIFKQIPTGTLLTPFRAYLNYAGSGAGSKSLQISFGDDTPTGIDGVTAKSTTVDCYDFLGRHVAHPVKGVTYIINGSKRVYE